MRVIFSLPSDTMSDVPTTRSFASRADAAFEFTWLSVSSTEDDSSSTEDDCVSAFAAITLAAFIILVDASFAILLPSAMDVMERCVIAMISSTARVDEPTSSLESVPTRMVKSPVATKRCKPFCKSCNGREIERAIRNPTPVTTTIVSNATRIRLLRKRVSALIASS